MLCPKPWPYTPGLPHTLARMEPVIMSIMATSHQTDGIWEKIIFGNSGKGSWLIPAVQYDCVYPLSRTEDWLVQFSLETILIYRTWSF